MSRPITVVKKQKKPHAGCPMVRYQLYCIHQQASQAGYCGKLISRSITVIKEKQKKPRFSFMFAYLHSHSLHVDSLSLSIANHKAETQVMHPVCEAGY